MRTGMWILSCVTVVALLTAGGPALYCAQASNHAMPCCKTSARCDLGMKAAACCTVEPASSSPEKGAGSDTRSDPTVPAKRLHAAAPHTEDNLDAVLALPGDGP